METTRNPAFGVPALAGPVLDNRRADKLISRSSRTTKHQIARFAVTAGMFASALLLSVGSAWGGGVVADCAEASLRAALNGGGLVTFSNDCTITIAQQIAINQATTIDAAGHNVSISASNAVPLFHAAANLTLRGLSLVNGNSPTSGGALYIQPGITVVATECIFAGNSATGTNGVAGANAATNSVATGGNGANGAQGTPAFGGAIYNLGSLALVNCTLTNNSATGGAGGAGGSGGAGSGTFAVGGNGGNGASGGSGVGGAVYNLGDLTLINCTFAGNSAVGGDGAAGGTGGAGSYPGMAGTGGAGNNGSGGAVFNGANLTLLTSTFSANSARGGKSASAGMHGNGTGLTGFKGGEGSGGGLYNAYWVAITNSTFYTNTVFGGPGGSGGNGSGTFAVPGDGGDGGNGVGGGLYNANTMTIVNCTFASDGAFGGTNGLAGSGNSTAENGKIGEALGGNIANNGPVLTVMNSILSASVSGGNSFGAFTDGGYNLSSDLVSSLGPNSLQNTNPMLGPLASNGGPTPTMALLTNSPAIDWIPPELGPSTDQRGFPRPVPVNGKSDIGAFEFGTSPAVSNVLMSITRTANGLVQLRGAGTSGFTYLVQASTNLANPANWQTISTNTGTIQFTDPATNIPARFYRITR